MATKTTLVNLLLGSSGTGSGTLQNRYCGGFLNPSNGLTVNAPVRDCTQPVSFRGFMMTNEQTCVPIDCDVIVGINMMSQLV